MIHVCVAVVRSTKNVVGNDWLDAVETICVSLKEDTLDWIIEIYNDGPAILESDLCIL